MKTLLMVLALVPAFLLASEYDNYLKVQLHDARDVGTINFPAKVEKTTTMMKAPGYTSLGWYLVSGPLGGKVKADCTNCRRGSTSGEYKFLASRAGKYKVRTFTHFYYDAWIIKDFSFEWRGEGVPVGEKEKLKASFTPRKVTDSYRIPLKHYYRYWPHFSRPPDSTALLLSDLSDFVVSAGSDASLNIWKKGSREWVDLMYLFDPNQTTRDPRNLKQADKIVGISFTNEDQTKLVAVNAKGFIFDVDLLTLKSTIRSQRAIGFIRDIAFSKDGRISFVTDITDLPIPVEYKKMQNLLIEFFPNNRFRVIDGSAKSRIHGLAYSPRGHLAYSKAGEVFIASKSSGRRQSLAKSNIKHSSLKKFSPSGDRLVLAPQRGSRWIDIIDLNSKTVSRADIGAPSQGFSFVDENTLIFGRNGVNKPIVEFDIPTNRLGKEYGKHIGSPTDVYFDSRSNSFIEAGFHYRVRVIPRN